MIYMLRLKPDDEPLWARVKTRAAEEGRPLRFVILALLKAYAERGFSVTHASASRE